MEQATLQATKRQDLGSRAARRLRKQGIVPAVLYGHQLGTVHLSLPIKEVERVLHAGSRMVTLEIGGTVETALLKDLQYDSMGDHLLHVDLSRIAMDQKVALTVPVELHGHAKGVLAGGVLDQAVRDIEVSCLPRDIPEKIRVEIADLGVDGIIYVRDLVPPPGVELLQDPDAPVVSIHMPEAEEAPPTPAEAAAPPEPELIRREKEEEPTEEAGKE